MSKNRSIKGSGDKLRNELNKIFGKYSNKAKAMFFKVENDADTDKILTYCGVLSSGLSVFFIAVELDRPLDHESLDLINEHIELIGRYDYMQGQSFVLFYEKSEGEWYKLTTDQLKICWQSKNRKNFPGTFVERVKKTVYGPDFLNEISVPFKLIRNDIDKNDPLAVFL